MALQLEDSSQTTSVPSKEVDVSAEPHTSLQKVFKEKQWAWANAQKKKHMY